MEAMMREIREGTKYCPSECASGSFSFINKAIEEVTYALKISSIGGYDEGYIERKVEGITPQRLTSGGIKITNLSFLVKGNVAGDKQQPLVTISISGESGTKEKLKSSLDLQATVSQRKLDSGT